MAKKAWFERNKRKSATVKKYAAKRAELKAKRDYAGQGAANRRDRGRPTSAAGCDRSYFKREPATTPTLAGWRL